MHASGFHHSVKNFQHADAGGQDAVIRYFKAGLFEKGKSLGPVVDIDIAKLPQPTEVAGWTSAKFVSVLRHDQGNPEYNLQFRQFIHVSFKIAAQMGARYTDALKRYESIIAGNVTGNLFDRHMKPLFS